MRYDAFISYRHSELDMFVAKSLHKGLETFKVPRMVAGKTGKKKIERVFRDQEELPIGSDLGDNIRKALEESEYLLVICSPRTPESYWVQKEIDTYISLHDREHVLAVLIEGEPDESFPKQILVDDAGNPVEPLAADVRGASRHEVKKKLKTEILRLAAPILGCSYDDLRQRHRERRMKKALAAAATVAVLALAFGAYSVYNTMMIRENYEGKQRNQSRYLADTSLQLLEQGDRVAAGLLALEALPGEGNDRPYVASAQYALSKAVNAYTNGSALLADRLLKHDFPVMGMFENIQGTKVASVDEGQFVYVWNLEDGSLLTKLAPELDEQGYVISVLDICITEADQLIIVTKQDIRALDLEGHELWRAEGAEEYSYCAFDVEDQIAACISGDVVQFYDMSDGTLIANLENETETSFSSETAFFGSGEKFAVSKYRSLLDEPAVNGEVCVYDFSTGTSAVYTTWGNQIMELAFATDGDLVVESTDRQALLGFDSPSVEAQVEKINLASGMKLWSSPFSFESMSMESSSSNLKCRSYTEESTGTLQNEVLMSINNTAYTWNADDGSIKAEIQTPSAIMDFLIASGSGMGYLVDSNGTINFFNLSNGTSYSDWSVKMERQVRQVEVANGVLIARSYAQPELLVMKYQEGYGMKTVTDFSESLEDMDVSAKESYYAVMHKDEVRTVSFFDAGTDEELCTWLPEGEGLVLDSRFISDSCYMVAESGGNLHFYDVDSREETDWSPEESLISSSVYVTDNNTYACVYTRNVYYVVDLETRRTVVQGSPDVELREAVLSGDGGTIYGNTTDGTVYHIDATTGTTRSLTDGWQASAAGYDQNRMTLALSPDEKYLAVSCRDNYLRVLDTETGELLTELFFTGQNRCFMSFFENEKLLVQGDTYIIYICDLARKEFIYATPEQYNRIQHVTYAGEEGIICIRTTVGLLLLNETDYEPLAEVDDGLIYMPGRDTIFNKHVYTLYRFPYMNLEQLIKEAQAQFGGQELTDQERMQYHVD